jgi:hypothetical protein
MTINRNNRKALRSLSQQQLQAVSGGIIGILAEYSSSAIGNPEESTSFTGGVTQYLPAVQR